MRKVVIEESVRRRMNELECYLLDELKLSEDAALRRSARMRRFVASLSGVADYSLCRFKKWRAQGWRCAVFEKNWIFAYEVFDGGIIVRDMSHAALLKE